MMMNLELNNMLLIDPVLAEGFEASDKLIKLTKIQNLMAVQNKDFPMIGPLHFLAGLSEWSDQAQELFAMLVSPESFQARMIRQKSGNDRSPLCEAILHGNIGFIEALLSSQSDPSVPHNLFDLEDPELLKAILR